MAQRAMTASDKGALLRQTTALGDYFGLLSVLLEYKLLKETCAGLSSGRIQADICSITDELELCDARVDTALHLLDTTSDEADSQDALYRDLRREYTRLFNHPEHPAVAFYEGMFINRRYVDAGRRAPDHELLFINQAACDTDRQYKRAGVKRSMDENIPGDCMATEMAFMSCLLRRETEALIAGDSIRLADLAAWLHEFARLHLRVWMGEFFLQVETVSQQPYFRAVGLLGQVLAEHYSRYCPHTHDICQDGAT